MAQADRDLMTLGDIIARVNEPVPEPVSARARLVVASYARDAEDCRLLLEELGLIGEHGGSPGGRVCAHCGRQFQHPGVRRRDSFCSNHCYRQTAGHLDPVTARGGERHGRAEP